MVVVDCIDGDTLASAKKGRNLDEKTLQIVRSEVQRAIEALHVRKLVFGDLRSPNVMITKMNEVKLIDFNWAGEEGQARYPSVISSDIKWAADVETLLKRRRTLANINETKRALANINDTIRRPFISGPIPS
jgi:RIO-like serine/threonine protein kinase